MRIFLRGLVVAAFAAAGMFWPEAGGAGTGVTLVVTKTVTGEAPDGVRFVIEVGCEGSDGTSLQTVTFGATGGSQSVTMSSGVTVCNVTERADGGAAGVTYQADGNSEDECSFTPTPDLIQVSFGDAATCGAVVVNSFPPSAGPPPPSEPPPTRPSVPAGPAPAIQVAPAFTG